MQSFIIYQSYYVSGNVSFVCSHLAISLKVILVSLLMIARCISIFSVRSSLRFSISTPYTGVV